MTLFQTQALTLHSGNPASWKIECDALTEDDLATIARLIAERLPPFWGVEGVPTGGLRLAAALTPYTRAHAAQLLIVDDVCTTGASLERQRAGRDAIGAVIFARGPWPAWVYPVFVLLLGGGPQALKLDKRGSAVVVLPEEEPS